MKKTNNLFLIFLLSSILFSGCVSAKLTKSMNCTFSCSGKRCGNESNTLVACLASCHPAYYKQCWDAGEQKFSEYKLNSENTDDPYFKEFNMLNEETQNIILTTLGMAEKIAAKSSSGKNKIDSSYEMQRNKMKKHLNVAAAEGSQDLKNWVRKALALEVKDAGNVLSLGVALPN